MNAQSYPQAMLGHMVASGVLPCSWRFCSPLAIISVADSVHQCHKTDVKHAYSMSCHCMHAL